MSRKVITILFIAGSCFYIPGIAMIIWGYVVLFQSSMYHSYYGTNPLDMFGTFMGFILAGAVMLVVGSTTLLVARIGALMEAAKAQEWVWFVLMIIFGWVVLLIYLLVGPKSKLAQPYGAYPHAYAVPGQPWPGYAPQGPGTMPPPVQPWPPDQPPAERRDVPPMPQE